MSSDSKTLLATGGVLAAVAGVAAFLFTKKKSGIAGKPKFTCMPAAIRAVNYLHRLMVYSSLEQTPR